MTDFSDKLCTGLQEMGLSLDSCQIAALHTYAAEINLWNKKINLIGDEDIAGRHILDALTGWIVVRDLKPKTVCDVGSGAGLPGIPLAICFPELKLTLNDRMIKRMGFLRGLVQLLGLNDRVHLAECQVHELKDCFDLVTCRAFMPYPDVVTATSHLLNQEGKLMIYAAAIPVDFKGQAVSLDYSFLTGPRNILIVSPADFL